MKEVLQEREIQNQVKTKKNIFVFLIFPLKSSLSMSQNGAKFKIFFIISILSITYSTLVSYFDNKFRSIKVSNTYFRNALKKEKESFMLTFLDTK